MRLLELYAIYKDSERSDLGTNAESSVELSKWNNSGQISVDSLDIRISLHIRLSINMITTTVVSH